MIVRQEARFWEYYRQAVSDQVLTDEFCMGLRPTYMDENRGEPKPYDGTGVGRRRPSLLWIC
jgi:hypothetical protein